MIFTGKSKKIAGILIEGVLVGARLEEMIIGAGINLNQTVFDQSLPNPVSLKMITGVDYRCLSSWPKMFTKQFFSGLKSLKMTKNSINSVYLKRLFRLSVGAAI